MVKDIYKPKVKALTDIWSIIMQKPDSYNREKAKILLEEKYKKEGILPFRGFNANDVYEKELSSLYVIGKYGLGLMRKRNLCFLEFFT